MAADIGYSTEEIQLAGARQDSKSEGVLAVNGDRQCGSDGSVGLCRHQGGGDDSGQRRH